MADRLRSTWLVSRDIAGYLRPPLLVAVIFTMLAGTAHHLSGVFADAAAAAGGDSASGDDPRPAPAPPQASDRPTRYDTMIREAALRHLPEWYDWRLFKALVAAESGFDPKAVSPAGAQGLCQLMPPTARGLGLSPDQVFDPAANLDAGARYLAECLGRFKESSREPPELRRVRLALAGYNRGPFAVLRIVREVGDEWSVVSEQLPGETRHYVARILERFYPQFAPAGTGWQQRPGASPPRPWLGGGLGRPSFATRR